MSLVNCWVATAVVLGAHQTLYHWDQYLGGAHLPFLTHLSLRMGPAVSITFLVLSLVGFAVAVLGRGEDRLQSVWFPVLALVELTLLALFALALIYPSFRVLYRLGEGGP
ncbi:MAG: hypothetical protein KDM81_01705 [Verrucomicrobiae bacterium]|nr:hypothetical protein [Verrucomicrobiae bacterium]